MEHQYGEVTKKHQRDELFNIGHVENRFTWMQELAEKVGAFDREELNRRLRMQVDSDSTYFDEQGRVANKEVATVRYRICEHCQKVACVCSICKDGKEDGAI